MSAELCSPRQAGARQAPQPQAWCARSRSRRCRAGRQARCASRSGRQKHMGSAGTRGPCSNSGCTCRAHRLATRCGGRSRPPQRGERADRPQNRRERCRSERPARRPAGQKYRCSRSRGTQTPSRSPEHSRSRRQNGIFL